MGPRNFQIHITGLTDLPPQHKDALQLCFIKFFRSLTVEAAEPPHTQFGAPDPKVETKTIFFKNILIYTKLFNNLVNYTNTPKTTKNEEKKC